MDKQSIILILGAQGMLGQDLAKSLSDFNLVLWDKPEIDITDENQVKEKISKLNPSVIINSAAYTVVDDCETNSDLAMKVNAKAVRFIAQTAKALDAILVHFSTDYVFNGNNITGYKEDSQEFGPQGVYGQSKFEAEKYVLDICQKYYLIRTSWLYGQNGKNFIETIKRLSQAKKELKVINDQFGKPTYTVDLAKQILYILDNELDFGIYHITNETIAGGITWYELAAKIIELEAFDAIIKPCSTDEYPLPAKRPAHSALINTKLPIMRNWQEALKEYLNS